MTMTATPRLPLAPLVAAAGLAGDPDWLARMEDRTGHHRNTLRRWARVGIPIYTADAIAVALGMHPCEPWPEWPTLTVAPLVRPHLTIRADHTGTRRAEHETVSAAYHYADHWADVWRRMGLAVGWVPHGRIVARDDQGSTVATLEVRLGPERAR